jgi:hypothetical protein
MIHRRAVCRSAVAASILIAACVPIGRAAADPGNGPVPQAGPGVPVPPAGDSGARPPGPSGSPESPCAAVERVARRYLPDPEDRAPHRVALRREVQRALDACRGGGAGASGRS